MTGARGGAAVARGAAVALLMATVAAAAAPVSEWRGAAPALPGPLLAPAAPAPAVEGLELAAGATGDDALAALKAGRFARACRLASATLARQATDADALGLFALCAASGNDRAAAAAALERLRAVEPVPYFGPLAQGVLQLHDQAPEAALSSFRQVLERRAGDPLALYFSGEAQHARGRDDEALRAFGATLSAWPGFVPALGASARLLATPRADRATLTRARELAERAAALEPTRPAHWRLLAELCERTGQHERASAIALQWLRPAAAASAAAWR
ncbi:MAG: hypothetical protein U1F56_12010 [Rubrivivax sp.]